MVYLLSQAQISVRFKSLTYPKVHQELTLVSPVNTNTGICASEQGCQIFLCTTYQNTGGKYTKLP
jgi:hypothetical protein